MGSNGRLALCAKTLVGAIFIAVLACLTSTVVWAGDVSPYANGPWLGFSFGAVGVQARGCLPADPDGGPCFIFGNSVPADSPPWTFAVGSSGGTLEVVDVFSTGDIFQVFNSGVSVGTTSASPPGGFCGADPDLCLGTSASYGLFPLSPGSYSITIKPTASPFNAGLAYFRLKGDIAGPPPPPQDTDGDGIPDDSDACPTSILTSPVIIGTCNSKVPNKLFSDGCTIADKIGQCTNGIGTHGMQTSCASNLLDQLKKDGAITGQQKDALQSCVARIKP
jgi:hypothetical protein